MWIRTRCLGYDFVSALYIGYLGLETAIEASPRAKCSIPGAVLLRVVRFA